MDLVFQGLASSALLTCTTLPQRRLCPLARAQSVKSGDLVGDCEASRPRSPAASKAYFFFAAFFFVAFFLAAFFFVAIVVLHVG
jgi:hypothetical protein